MTHAQEMHEKVDQVGADWAQVDRANQLADAADAMRSPALQRLYEFFGGPEYVRLCNQRYGWSQSTAYLYKDPDGHKKHAEAKKAAREAAKSNSGRPENGGNEPSEPEYETKSAQE